MTERIPKRQLWTARYRAYRHKYGRLKALWRGVVFYEILFLPHNIGKGIAKRMVRDELELLQYLVSIEVEVELGALL